MIGFRVSVDKSRGFLDRLLPLSGSLVKKSSNACSATKRSFIGLGRLGVVYASDSTVRIARA